MATDSFQIVIQILANIVSPIFQATVLYLIYKEIQKFN